MPFEHSSLDPAGPMAASIAQLWWVFVGVSTVVYLVVIAFLVLALVRRRRAMAATKRKSADGRSLLMVSSAVGLTVVILITLAVSDFIFGRVLADTPADPLRVQIIG